MWVKSLLPHLRTNTGHRTLNSLTNRMGTGTGMGNCRLSHGLNSPGNQGAIRIVTTRRTRGSLMVVGLVLGWVGWGLLVRVGRGGGGLGDGVGCELFSFFFSFSCVFGKEMGEGGRVCVEEMVGGEPWLRKPLVQRPWFPHRLLRHFRASHPAFFLAFTQSSMMMNRN